MHPQIIRAFLVALSREYSMEVEYCVSNNGMILPSCEGHVIVTVHRDDLLAALKAAEEFGKDTKGFGDITVAVS